MKKIIALVIVLALILSLPACGSSVDENSSDVLQNNLQTEQTNSQTDTSINDDNSEKLELDEVNNITREEIENLIDDKISKIDTSIIAEEAKNKIDTYDIAEKAKNEIDINNIVEEVKKEIDIDNIAKQVSDKLEASDTFVVGEKVTSPMGESFKMHFERDYDDYATINSFQCIKLRENNINDFETYNYDGFYDFRRYTYQVTVSGKADKSYAGKALYFHYQFENNQNTVFEGSCRINSDGTFSFEELIHANQNANEIYPYSIRIRDSH